MPKYDNKSNRNDKINKIREVPYTFVPFPKSASRSACFEGENTGYIVCKLKTINALAIPDASLAVEVEPDKKEKDNSGEDNKKHKEYPCMTVDCDGKKFIILGSSIRGVIRNIYECVTDSCVSQINKDKNLKSGAKVGVVLKAADLLPCTSHNKVCPACNLFGMIGSFGQNDAIGSRVRFSDALSDYDENKLLNNGEKVVLKNLLGPVSDAKYYEDETIGIKGRKFYWMQKSIDYKEKDGIRTNLNTSMQLIKKNTDFEFKVFFDRITDEELAQLCWVLTLGSNDDSKIYHKLGRGKPLGIGSVKITVSEIVKREYASGKYSQITLGEELINKMIESANSSISAPARDKLLEISSQENAREAAEVAYGGGSVETVNHRNTQHKTQTEEVEVQSPFAVLLGKF